MKKRWMPLLLAVCLLLAGCGETAPEPSSAPTAGPTSEPVPTEAPASETPSPTPEPTPTPTAVPRFTAGEETVYVLCVGQTTGAKALGMWLRSEGAAVTAAYVPEGLDGPMFTNTGAETLTEEIPAAADETRRVRVAADTFLLESGLLGELLPQFEAAAGYICEVYAGDIDTLIEEINIGEADILLMKKSDAALIGGMAQYPTRYDFASTIYTLTGSVSE